MSIILLEQRRNITILLLFSAYSHNMEGKSSTQNGEIRRLLRCLAIDSVQVRLFRILSDRIFFTELQQICRRMQLN